MKTLKHFGICLRCFYGGSVHFRFPNILKWNCDNHPVSLWKLLKHVGICLRCVYGDSGHFRFPNSLKWNCDNGWMADNFSAELACWKCMDFGNVSGWLTLPKSMHLDRKGHKSRWILIWFVQSVCRITVVERLCIIKDQLDNIDDHHPHKFINMAEIMC